LKAIQKYLVIYYHKLFIIDIYYRESRCPHSWRSVIFGKTNIYLPSKI